MTRKFSDSKLWVCDGCLKRSLWVRGWGYFTGVPSVENPGFPMAVCSDACELPALAKATSLRVDEEPAPAQKPDVGRAGAAPAKEAAEKHREEVRRAGVHAALKEAAERLPDLAPLLLGARVSLTLHYQLCPHDGVVCDPDLVAARAAVVDAALKWEASPPGNDSTEIAVMFLAIRALRAKRGG